LTEGIPWLRLAARARIRLLEVRSDLEDLYSLPEQLVLVYVSAPFSQM
jgi:hypothetical protein